MTLCLPLLEGHGGQATGAGKRSSSVRTRSGGVLLGGGVTCSPYEVVMLVDGLNGATAPVAAIWIIEGDVPPRLVLTWVDIP